MNIEIYEQFPKKYDSDINRMADELIKEITFEDGEDPKEYKSFLLSKIKEKPVALITWHTYVAGLLSFEIKNNLIYIDTIIVEMGFRGKDIIDTLKEGVKYKYNDYNIMYCNTYAGNECFLPIPEELIE